MYRLPLHCRCRPWPATAGWRSELLQATHFGRTLASSSSGEEGFSAKVRPTPRKNVTKPSLIKRLWRGSAEDDKTEAQEAEHLDDEYSRQVALMQQVEAEEEAHRLERMRNKSKLSASDRRVLNGQPPIVGHELPLVDRHRSVEYKRALLGRFGSTATGIRPTVCWPNEEDMEDRREYERVFYDGRNLRERMQDEWERQEAERKHMVEREEKLSTNLAKMERDLVAWRQRVSKKNETAVKAQQKLEKILAELREEFGYDIDPQNPQMKEKIAEKEEALKKQEKEAKKKERKERAQQKKQLEKS